MMSIVFVVMIVVLSLFRSIDPLSMYIWGMTDEFGETLYDLRGHSSGGDGVTYNMQYVSITDKRTALIRSIERSMVLPQIEKDCLTIFPDPRSDKITLRALGLNKTMIYGLVNCSFAL